MFLLTLATEGQECIIECIVYTRDQLIVLCKPALLCEPALLPGTRPEVLKELRRRHRGCRAGVKQRVKKRRHRPAVVLTAPPETVTYWIFYMQMLRMHTVPQSSPPWKI